MIRATGGSACDATSTKSSPLSNAYCFASDVALMPSCSPSSSISRTWDERMLSLILACGTGLEGGSIVRLGLKEQSPSSLQSFLRTTKPLQAAARDPRLSDSVQPTLSSLARVLRNVGAPASQSHSVASSRRNSSKPTVACSP